MYSKLPNLTIGFHGCDYSVFKEVLHKHQLLAESKNSYDWLGNGIYFWENNYQRAMQWAKDSKKIKTPAVIGAVIDLGNCLNLTDNKSIEIIKQGYKMLKYKMELLQSPMPVNRNIKNNADLIVRDLDCAVIQEIHAYNEINSGEERINKYDSVRGVFIEGNEVYPNSGFREKTHVQICIVNPNCIKGYFRPLIKNDCYCTP